MVLLFRLLKFSSPLLRLQHQDQTTHSQGCLTPPVLPELLLNLVELKRPKHSGMCTRDFHHYLSALATVVLRKSVEHGVVDGGTCLRTISGAGHGGPIDLQPPTQKPGGRCFAESGSGPCVDCTKFPVNHWQWRNACCSNDLLRLYHWCSKPTALFQIPNFVHWTGK